MAEEDVIYARLSYDKTGAGLAVERQVSEVLEHFKLPADTRVYADNDISATSGKPRPEYLELVKQMRAGQIRRVYTWHTDRVWRAPRDLEDFIDAQDSHGVATYAKMAGQMDLSTPGGRVAARIGVAIAKYEVEIKADRQKAANLQRAQDGQPYAGGVRLFGFKADLVTHDRREASAIKRAARDVLAGRTLAECCRRLDESGVLTAKGNTWNIQGLKAVLTNPRIAGKISYKGEQYVAAYKPILSEETWLAVCAKLGDPKRRTNPRGGRSPVWPLSGIALCGKCADHGETSYMITNYAGGHKTSYRSYLCRTYRHMSVKADIVDFYVEWTIKGALLGALHYDALRDVAERFGLEFDPPATRRVLDRIRGGGNPESETFRQRVDEIRARVEEIDAAMANPSGQPLAALLSAREQLTKDLAKAEHDLARSVPSPALGRLAIAQDIIPTWDGLDISEKRQATKEICAITLRTLGVGKRVTKDNVKQVVTIKWLD